MHRPPVVILVLASLSSICFVVSSGRTGEEDREDVTSKDAKPHVEEVLQNENANLREEVKELRAELRVAASGAFARKRNPSASMIETSAEETARQRRSGRNASDATAGVAASNESASEATVGGLDFELLDVSEAIARDAANATKAGESHDEDSNSAQVRAKTRPKDGHNASAVLFVIYSTSKFYDTRVRWARKTWANKVPASRLVIIGDSEAPKLQGAHVHKSRCNHYDHGLGMGCKYAEAVVVAQTMMLEDPEIKWAYFADDDTYIRPAVLERTLLQQPPSHPRDRGLVLANFGCVTAHCSGLLCGGSGYAANRWAIEIMAGADPAGFVQELLRGCLSCGGDVVSKRGSWGEAGLSEVIKNRGIEQRTLNGIYGWLLDKSCLEVSLESEHEPLMYHMIRTQPQMEMLHRLFAPIEEQTGSSSPPGVAVALDGVAGCVEFRGNIQCAASRSDEDRPWHRGPQACHRPRMPRLPVLLGVFTLALLLAILATLLWTGVKFHQWEGWKLQGMKLHAYPMQGRSRFR